jgi:hypothetical protein
VTDGFESTLLLRSIFGNISRSSNFLPAKSGDSLIWGRDGMDREGRGRKGVKRKEESGQDEGRKEEEGGKRTLN